MENLKLPIALVLAMAVQLAGGVWWVSQQASTISGLEETVSQLGSRMAIEDNINLKRDVANNNDDIGRIWNEVEEVWEEIAGLAATITRVTEVQQRVAIIENELKYLTRGPK
jgi:uncharacterized protein Yka (UPF0111/DUF47 family)